MFSMGGAGLQSQGSLFPEARRITGFSGFQKGEKSKGLQNPCLLRVPTVVRSSYVVDFSYPKDFSCPMAFYHPPPCAHLALQVEGTTACPAWLPARLRMLSRARQLNLRTVQRRVGCSLSFFCGPLAKMSWQGRLKCMVLKILSELRYQALCLFSLQPPYYPPPPPPPPPLLF